MVLFSRSSVVKPVGKEGSCFTTGEGGTAALDLGPGVFILAVSGTYQDARFKSTMWFDAARAIDP